MKDLAHVSSTFKQVYGAAPTIVAFGPGRVNLIGEHVDYAGGYVMPAALDLGVTVALGIDSTTKGRLKARSPIFHKPVDLDLLTATPDLVGKSWARYLVAVVDQLVSNAWIPPLSECPGINIFVDSDLPLGAGLSSSAAIEVAVASALVQALAAKKEVPPSPLSIALLAQAAEHGPFVGTKCGIMDQYASALGVAHHALLLDCHALTHEIIPLNPAKSIMVIMNSMKKRGLVDSAYNARRAESEQGLDHIRRSTAQDFPTLRHVPIAAFESCAESLDPVVRRRVRHHVTENLRTLKFAEAMRRDDLQQAGALLLEGHASLRDDYQVSCPELDALVDCASKQIGCYGARLTGAGFGGCAIALVDPGSVGDFVTSVTKDYARHFQVTAQIFASGAGAGARILSA